MEKEKVSKIPKAPSYQYIAGPTDSNGQSSFKDQTSSYGLANLKAIRTYAIDFNHDGFVDIVTLSDFYSFPLFFKYNPKKLKFEKLDYNPLGAKYRASFLNFVDLNGDEINDLILSSFTTGGYAISGPVQVFHGKLVNKKIVYQLQKGIFPFGKKESTGLSLVDFNLDGLVDIFQANWVTAGKDKRGVPNNLFFAKRVKKGKQLKLGYLDFSYLLKDESKVDENSKEQLNARPTMGSSTCDFNRDGYPDILTSNTNGLRNKLWLNTPKNNQVKFLDLGESSQFAEDLIGVRSTGKAGATFFAGCSDINGDGIFDILVGELGHSYDPEYKDKTSILIGKKGKAVKFDRKEFPVINRAGSWNRADRRGIWVDLNGDTLLDLILVNTGYPPHTRLEVYLQTESGFQEKGKELGIDILNPSGTTILDVNRDGRPDILTGQSRVRAPALKNQLYLFINQEKKGQGVHFYLKGDKSNKNAIGSITKVVTNKKVHLFYHEASFGAFPSQNQWGHFFSLGEGEKILSATVNWPYKTPNGVLKKEYNLKGVPIKNSFTLCETGETLLSNTAKCKSSF